MFFAAACQGSARAACLIENHARNPHRRAFLRRERLSVAEMIAASRRPPFLVACAKNFRRRPSAPATLRGHLWGLVVTQSSFGLTHLYHRVTIRCRIASPLLILRNDES